jgi:hypothetical protein
LVIHARPRRAAMVSEDDAAEEPGDVFIALQLTAPPRSMTWCELFDE